MNNSNIIRYNNILSNNNNIIRLYILEETIEKEERKRNKESDKYS